MRIAAASHRVPETRYSNQDVIDIIVERSRHDCTDDELKAIQRWIGKSFQWTGSQHRHLAMNGEGMLDITKLAVSEALDKAELKPEEIDLVIYTGVARGWLEPATAAFVQNQAGAHNATCFDVLDACAGWFVSGEATLVRAGSSGEVVLVGPLPEPGSTIEVDVRGRLPAFVEVPDGLGGGAGRHGLKLLMKLELLCQGGPQGIVVVDHQYAFARH